MYVLTEAPSFDIGGIRCGHTTTPRTNPMSKTDADSVTSAPPDLVGAEGLLEILWPHPKGRPSLRWLRSLTAKRVIPVTRIGRRTFFSPARVAAALRKFEIAPR